MKKRQIRRKLIMAITAATTAAITLGTSTYAWFSRNDIVWTEQTEFNLDFYSGLLISFDGKNFHQDVTKDELYQAITGLEDKTEAEAAFKKISFDGVTPLQENGKIQYDDNNNIKFVYDIVNEETYEHTYANAKKNDKYLQFDLWFRIADGGTVTGGEIPKYNLVFTDKTNISSKAGAQKVELYNSLTTMERTYITGEKLDVDGANALRVGIQTYKSDKTPNSTIIYEPVNEYNLGSAAVEGRTDDLHNPAKNAMYTYYNNFFSQKLTKAADDGEAFDTHSKFNDGTSLGVFEGVVGKDLNDNPIYKYNDIKLTLCIWLEGWDADYFYGITSSNVLARTMLSYFEFTYQEV